MAYLLVNPYAAYSGKQRLQSGQGEFGFWGDPYGTLEHFTEIGPGWSAGESGDLRAKAEFAPYVTQQQLSWGDSYDNYWQADFDALNAAMNAKVAADTARYNTMAGWDDESLQMAGGAPNYAGQLARALGMTPKQFQDWSAAQGANWGNEIHVGSAVWNNNANPFVNQRIGLDTLINAYGLGNNAEIMNWRNSIEGTLSEGGDRYADMLQDSDSSVLGTFLKGVGFVAGALGGFSSLGALAGANVATAGAGALGIPGGGFGIGANSLWGSALGELGFGQPSGWDFGPGNVGDSGWDFGPGSINDSTIAGDLTRGQLGQVSGWDFGPGNLGDGLISGFDQVGDMGRQAYDEMMRQVSQGADPASFDWNRVLQGGQAVYDLVSPFVQMGMAGGEGYRTETLSAEEDALFGAKKFGRSQQLMPAGAYDTFNVGNPGLFIP